jgi:hypothetical protein
VAGERAGRDRGAGRGSDSARARPTVEFAFGAVFTSIRTIPLRAGRAETLDVSGLLHAASGRFWVADARAAALKIYSEQGWRLRTLGRQATGLRRPVSLTPVHGRWVAALDGSVPGVVVLDESGRALSRFPLPELDCPAQICNLADHRLAVVGSGYGPGAGKLVHIYTAGGEHIESLFAEPRDERGGGRAFVAAAGETLYLGHSQCDSFWIYDVDAHSVVSFPSLTARLARRLGSKAGFAWTLCGLFATACGPLLAGYSRGSAAREYLYDLYALDGTPVALGLRAAQRVVGVEGPFFYSVSREPDAGTTLAVWKLESAGEASD